MYPLYCVVMEMHNYVINIVRDIWSLVIFYYISSILFIELY